MLHRRGAIGVGPSGTKANTKIAADATRPQGRLCLPRPQGTTVGIRLARTFRARAFRTHTKRTQTLRIVQGHKGIGFSIAPDSHPLLLTGLFLSYHKDGKKSKTTHTTTVFHLPRI